MDKALIKSLREASNTGIWLESRLHTYFTEMADMMYGDGYLTRDERKALSHAIGEALTAFTSTVEADAPDLYKRGRWQEPESVTGDLPVTEAGVLARVKEFLRSLTGERPINESEMTGDFVPLVERAVRRDGTIPIKIIQPGWGSSGYYPAEVLERDGPNVFTKGVKMYFDHPTMTEEAERPERSLRDLAAELVSDARWEKENPAGPGLYAEAQVFEAYRPAVDELAPHIGVSIRANGRAQFGQAEGKSGPIIQEITSAKSVDFVTSPGAGGQILSLFEARRDAAHNTIQPKESTMSDAELKALQEANAQLQKQLEDQRAAMSRLQEAALLREAGEFVATELAAVTDLPVITRNRLLRDLAARPVIKDGAIDREAYKAAVAEAVRVEREYIASLTGAGNITGMGESKTPEPKPEELTASLAESLAAIMGNSKLAEIAAKGR